MSSLRLPSHYLTVAGILAVLVCLAQLVKAGGPLVVIDGEPVRWSRTEIRGGSLNAQTVNARGEVLYRVDSGPLGPLSNSRAVALIDRIFRMYNDIPTSSLRFINAGPILDPDTGMPVDVNGSNVNKYRSSARPTFQNPIIFDSNGEISGGGGVLGSFGFIQFDPDSNSLSEGYVILNGAAVESIGGEIPFLGVFTHEVGHFAGPLDHAQISGNIAIAGAGSVQPPGRTRAEVFDLYLPFTETLFPFLAPSAADRAPAGSVLRAQGFWNNGFFTATLDLDTQNALSNLYPTVSYRESRGAIEGRVLLRTTTADIPVSGINVVARRISRGPYPPSPGTEVFARNQVLVDTNGVPFPPPDNDSTDSLATASSAVTGLEFGVGAYRIQGLPPGEYLVGIQQINPNAINGSGIGPLHRHFPLPVEEFYNGPGESGDPSDDPADFAGVQVTAGGLVSGIDIVLNLSTATPAVLLEAEPNDKKKKAQKLKGAVELRGSAAQTDLGKLKMRLPNGSADTIQDLFKFTVREDSVYILLLEPTAGFGDLDFYLFDSGVDKKNTSLTDPHLLAFSAGPSSNELIAMRLNPGTYFIGISAFSGNQDYLLRVLPSR